MDSQAKKSGILTSIVDYVELIVVAICVVIVLFSLVFRTCTVDGDSMNKTLLDKEMLIVSNLAYTPQRQDIIVFHHAENSLNKPLVKRVIGIGGDTVRINYNTWEITVTDKNGNSQVLEEGYMYLSDSPSAFSGIKEYVVPEGSLFVLGDNRNGSLDSRYQTVGFVDQRSVLGKVFMRVSPISRFGFVD